MPDWEDAGNRRPAGYNYEESEVSVLHFCRPCSSSRDGRPVSNVEHWRQRRQELLEQFLDACVSASSPVGRPEAMTFVEGKVVKNFLGGRATLKEVAIRFTGEADGPVMNLLVVVPNSGKPSPGADGF